MLYRAFTLFLLLLGTAHAQVNVEKIRATPIKDGASGQVGLSTSFTQGNIDFADFTVGSFVAYKSSPHLIFWVTTLRFAAKRTQGDYLAEPDVGLWDDEAHFSNNALTHLRYNYKINDWLAWEVFTQFEYNEFLLLDRRVLGGTGPRFTLVDKKGGGLWFGTAAMVENERLNPESIAPTLDPDSTVFRSSNYITGELSPSEDVSWVTTVYFQPQVPAFADFRLVGETGLAFNINKTFVFTTDFRYRYDAVPPETAVGIAPVLATDISLKSGIAIKW
jgi:hypothetical protein